jgi:hypothetical protein
MSRRKSTRARRVGGRVALVGGAVLVAALPLAGAIPSSGATPTINVSGYSAARTNGAWGITQSCLATTKGYLTNAANFGPSGVVKDTMAVTSTGIDTATSTNLKGVNIFVTGYTATDSYTSAEKTALLNYVKGGGAMLVTTDDTEDDISSLFGLTLEDATGGIVTGTITDSSSPLADGPFGKVSSFTEYDAVGAYTNTGPGTVVGTNPDGAAIVVIPPGRLSPTSGPVVLVSDVDVFSDCPEEDGATDGSITNEVLIKNVFAYLATAAVPPPSTTTTAPTTTTEPTTSTMVAPVAAAPAFTG